LIQVKVNLAKLRAARAYKGLTIQQVSKLLGYKANGYAYLESGKVPFFSATLELSVQDIRSRSTSATGVWRSGKQ